MMNFQAIAIIPARGGSKRFPRKNIALLDGKPLLTYPLKVVRDSNQFEEVFVSTEDSEISDIAKRAGARVHDRKVEFATDTAHELDACLDLLDDWEASGKKIPDYICVIYPTAILIEEQDLVKSCEILKENSETEVVMCVSEFNYHPYKSLTVNEQGYLEMMFPVECKQRSQSYPSFVASNGTFYWVHVETLRKNRIKSYYQDRLKPYIIPYERAVDIDYPEDLKKAELMIKMRKEK
ncbi:MAG: acylneuraminate cytidylyltransferase family protein [Alphaproteobacteria bacterium]